MGDCRETHRGINLIYFFDSSLDVAGIDRVFDNASLLDGVEILTRLKTSLIGELLRRLGVSLLSEEIHDNEIEITD